MIDRLQGMIDRLQHALPDMEQLPEAAQEELAAQIETLLERLEPPKQGQRGASSKAKKRPKKGGKIQLGPGLTCPTRLTRCLRHLTKSGTRTRQARQSNCHEEVPA